MGMGRQVRWRVTFSREGLEAEFGPYEAIVDQTVTEDAFRRNANETFLRGLAGNARPQAWIDANYPPGNFDAFIRSIPESDLRYLAVQLEVVAFLSSSGDTGNAVHLPPSRIVAGPLEQRQSEFGDEFFGLPTAFGQRPLPGRTFLTGWIEFTFDAATGTRAHFAFRYLGLGTPTTNTWGGGQRFDHERTRCVPMDFLPDMKTRVLNEGILDLRTGLVDPASIKLFSIFQTTIVGRTDRANRIGYAFPFMFPVFPPVPPVEQRPPNWTPPPDDLPVFAQVLFRYDWNGSIIGAEVRSETNALIGLFPILNRTLPPAQRIFPPFAFGPKFQFFFSNPTGHLAGTPPENQFTPELTPNGTPTDPSVFFHPHLTLRSNRVRPVSATEIPVPCVPRATARAVSVVSEDRLYLIGGLTADGVTAAVQIYDSTKNRWMDGPDLPFPVFGSQGAAVSGRIYVVGGWTSDTTQGRDMVRTVQVLDTATLTWSMGPEVPDALAEATATAVDGKVYVVAGWNDQGGVSNRLYVLDPVVNEWSRGRDASLPTAAAAAVAVGQCIYVMSGRFMDNVISHRTVIYDTRKSLWSVGPDLITGVIAGVAGLVEGRLLLVGGRDQVGGAALRRVQELDLKHPKWRLGLPQPVQAAGSGGGVIGSTFYMFGGRVLAGTDALPGELTDLTQTFTTFSDWTLSETRPVFTSTGVLNAAALVVGPRNLAPAMRAVIVGDRFCVRDAKPADALAAITVLIDDKPSHVLKVQPDRIDFVTPHDMASNGEKVLVQVICATSERQAPPVRVSAATLSPGLFTYAFGETQEPVYLDDGPALAANEDGTLNFGDQPAVPGSRLVLYATGLGRNPTPRPRPRGSFPPPLRSEATPEVWMGPDFARKARVLEVRPTTWEGVFEIEIVIPEITEFSNNVPVVLKIGGVQSNRVVVTVAATEARLEPPITLAEGEVFVFGPPSRSLLAFRPVAELDVDMKQEAGFWRHTRSTER